MPPAVPALIDRGDLDGFFGLFIDNLVQLLLIAATCGLAGITAESSLLVDHILPGAAISILVGNLFYSWQARQLARRENRSDVTALPYGINTPSVIVFILFVMKPAYEQQLEALGPDLAARYAWQMGLVACLGSGLIEFFGSFVAEFIRVKTPRAALLSTLAGIAIGFISMTFALSMFSRPLVALVPLAFLLLTYFARYQFPMGIPGGFLAVLVGTLLAWIAPQVLPAGLVGPPMSVDKFRSAASGLGWHPPRYAGEGLFDLLLTPSAWQGYLTVIVPMGLFNLIGSLQNIESAEAAGDRYHTGASLAANGLGTIVAAGFGSCFPTTIYIGHPGWKELGAKSSYSVWNGVVITAVALSGCLTLINALIPTEAGMAIILWIGLIITAQAFQTTPRSHAPAVAMGLFPAIAAWGAVVVTGAFDAANGRTIQSLLEVDGGPLSANVSGFLIHGLIVLERGYIFTCLLLAAMAAELIERRFAAAAVWSGLAALCALVGMTHSYQIEKNLVDFYFPWMGRPDPGSFSFSAEGLALSYGLLALIFGIVAATRKRPDAGSGDSTPSAAGP